MKRLTLSDESEAREIAARLHATDDPLATIEAALRLAADLNGNRSHRLLIAADGIHLTRRATTTNTNAVTFRATVTD